MDEHVDFIISQCSQRLYPVLIKIAPFEYCQITRALSYALIISRPLYAKLVRCRFLTVGSYKQNRDIVEKLKRLFGYGYLAESVSFSQRCHASHDLFTKMPKNTCCLLLGRLMSQYGFAHCRLSASVMAFYAAVLAISVFVEAEERVIYRNDQTANLN